MRRRGLSGGPPSALRQVGVDLETGDGEDCPWTDFAEICVVRHVHEDVYGVRVATADLLCQQQFSGCSRSDASNERHLRTAGQFRGVCERNVNWRLSRIARIVIRGNDEALSQKIQRSEEHTSELQ